MGVDIKSFVEVKNEAGKWIRFEEEVFCGCYDVKSNEPFEHRNYSVYGFLADVRNYSECKPISELKGLPEDSEYLNEVVDDFWFKSTRRQDIVGDNFGCSWILLKELLDFDYEETFLDMRGCENGNLTTYREHLGHMFFYDLERLKELGDPEKVRVVFWFN